MMQKRNIVVVLMVVLALVLVTAVAYAITITVDGIQDPEWIATIGGQTPGVITDPGMNESAIGDDVDINLVRFTNDTDYYYLLIETYATTRWTRLGISGLIPQIQICMDIDNNTATGVSGGGNCLDQPGVDRLISITGPTPTISVVDSTGASVVDGTEQVATSGAITELRISNAVLGFSNAVCPPTVPAVVYFDGGTTAPDDNTPDAGSANFGCGTPTAVTLQNVSASGQSAVLPFALGTFGLIIFSAGLVINRKRQTAN